MIEIEDGALNYFRKLIAQQGISGMGIRLRALHGGTPRGDCKLEFCEPEDVTIKDYQIELEGFSLFLDHASAPFLEGASITYVANKTGGELTIKAPRLRGEAPKADASVLERVQYVLDSEINPSVAAHGGRVSLLELTSEYAVVLQFGGGCQGCGMADVTLKQGIEKTLRARIPEITAVLDATEHGKGENPYYRDTQGKSAVAP
jgi:Fe/S biogenesis protein NfuA